MPMFLYWCLLFTTIRPRSLSLYSFLSLLTMLCNAENSRLQYVFFYTFYIHNKVNFLQEKKKWFSKMYCVSQWAIFVQDTLPKRIWQYKWYDHLDKTKYIDIQLKQYTISRMIPSHLFPNNYALIRKCNLSKHRFPRPKLIHMYMEGGVLRTARAYIWHEAE